MATTYVIETFRFLGRMGNLRDFQGCEAVVVSDPAEFRSARSKSYDPAAWRELLNGPDVMYRHKDDSEFRRPYP